MSELAQFELYLGDCLDGLDRYPDNSLDAFVEDPPSSIKFMGQTWDNDKGGVLPWIDWLAERQAKTLQKLKPGGYGVVWGLPRTSFMTGFALWKAGFVVKDVITHLFATGMPKDYDVAKGIEALLLTGSANWNNFRKLAAKAGSERPEAKLGYTKLQAAQGYRPEEYQTSGAFELNPQTAEAMRYLGYGTSLKPASEHWYLIQKPLEGGYARNALKWGTGALNIDASRIGEGTGEWREQEYPDFRGDNYNQGKAAYADRPKVKRMKKDEGRWPTNVVMSHSLWCVPLEGKFWRFRNKSGSISGQEPSRPGKYTYGLHKERVAFEAYGDQSGYELVPAWDCAPGCPIGEFASRNQLKEAALYYPNFHPEAEDLEALFLYAAKASPAEKNEGLDGLPPRGKVYNGQSQQSSKMIEPGSIEDKFTTNPQPNNHPTVKNLQLMTWLLRLVMPPITPNYTPVVLDKFVGSGTTGVAALRLGYRFIGMEEKPAFMEIAERRLRHAIEGQIHQLPENEQKGA